MGDDYIPEKNTEAALWMRCFANGLVESPQAYYILPEEAAEIDARVREYYTALATSLAPSTRTESANLVKDIARKAAEFVLRPAARRIRADRRISAEVKQNIGLAPYAQRRKRIPVPESVPVLHVRLELADYFTISVHDSEKSGRGRPKEAGWMELYERIIPPNADGSYPPKNDPSIPWRLIGSFTSTPIRHRPQDAVSGSMAMYGARWMSRRGEPGPFGSPCRIPVPFNSAALFPSSALQSRRAA